MSYPGVSQNDRLLAMLSYVLSIFCIVGPLAIHLLRGAQSRFVAFHALQAMILWGGLLLFGIATFGGQLTFQFIGLRDLSGLLANVRYAFGVVWLIAVIIGAIKAHAGEDYEMPLIGWHARRLARM